METYTRRDVLTGSAALAAGAVLPLEIPVSAATPDTAYRSAWSQDLDRVWLGADYWAGPLQDWQVRSGRIECIHAAPGRNVQVLTCEHSGAGGGFMMKVTLGRVDGSPLGRGKGSAGFRIGILGTLAAYPELRDYRNNLAFSSGIDAGITAQGSLFFGDVKKAAPGVIKLNDVSSLTLVLTGESLGTTTVLTLRAMQGDQLLGEVKSQLATAKLAGNLALVANFGAAPGGPAKKGKKTKEENAGPGAGTFWFSDWEISGPSVRRDDSHAFGPILFNHYTLSGGVMKMTAQMPPVGGKDSQVVKLEVWQGDAWQTAGEAAIHPLARTATFRIADWDATKDAKYRLVYGLKFADGTEKPHTYEGTVRRDPVDQPVLSVADISCNIHSAFPNAPYVAGVARMNPDMMAFVGDQFYESTAGFGIVRAPLETAALDYLRKWYFHGWTWRELTKDRPSVSLPDDHDVFQGNLWGEGGAARTTTQEAGGYDLEAEWVNVVHRTQTSHHPDPWVKEPCKQGILNYFGPLTYGRVSFAILADRQFKSAPEGKVPPTGDRGDHVIDLNFDPKVADIPGLDLLGRQQVDFLKAWATDWKGADMKAVISQTIFTGMATTHGGDREVLRADYDQNGWPQSARNAAVREMRKAFAFHIAGDQHLPAVVHYGIDSHRDAGVAFAGPAVNTGYPRWWEPTVKVNGRGMDQGLLGDFKDHFGHPMTVLAVKNGAIEPRKETMENLTDKTSGFGMVRFDKARRTITIECWPFGIEFQDQFPGWPVAVSQLDNYARAAVAWLPRLEIEGAASPVVQVVDETSGEIVYTLRPPSGAFDPWVFSLNKHTVRVSDPESGRVQQIAGLEPAAASGRAAIQVKM